jgi:hypothetical protein
MLLLYINLPHHDYVLVKASIVPTFQKYNKAMIYKSFKLKMRKLMMRKPQTSRQFLPTIR